MANKNSFPIRLATMRDACNIASLCGQLGYRSTTTDVERRLNYILISEDHALFVAENTDGHVVGWGHVHKYILPYALPGEDWIADVGGVVVDENFRGEGIGNRLVQSIEQWARENDAVVTIRSNVIRKESHRFYKAIGYDRVKEQVTFIKNINK